MRGALSAALSNLGVDVQTATTVVSASSRLAHERFDLLVMGLLLPDGTGMDAVRAAHRLGHASPFLLVTGPHDLPHIPHAARSALGLVTNT